MRCFGPCCRTLKIRESRRTPSPQLWECWDSPLHLAEVGLRQKSLVELGMSHHASNRQCRQAIIASIPWRLAKSSNTPKEGDWISNPTPPSGAPLDYIYFVLSVTPGEAKAIKFKRSAPRGRIQASTNQVITIAIGNLLPVRILAQKRPGVSQPHFGQV